MDLAIKLAKKGGRAVAPNPMVGAVMVKDGKVIGQGYHRHFGGPHAEVEAIQSVKNKTDLRGATLYVTLEPCRHHGKTPPCWDLVKSVGITHVIAATPDPLHGGKTISDTSTVHLEFLKDKMAKECRTLNRFFFCWAEKKRPFITVKVAQSADGFVAKKDGQPVHITSKKQDQFVHQLRAEHQAILVGSGTVLADDPHLGVRYVSGPDPLRIVLDSKNRIPKTAQVFRDGNFLLINKRQSLKTLFRHLGKQGIISILVEPGPTLYQQLKKEKLIDELILLKGQKKLGEGLKIRI